MKDPKVAQCMCGAPLALITVTSQILNEDGKLLTGDVVHQVLECTGCGKTYTYVMCNGRITQIERML